jgi:choline dehydrogenase-like flavoprotein
MQEMWVENSYLQQLFFPPNLDESVFYDVIVVGSGIGGGILADQLSDLNLNVLVLEAGSYLFPTHIANLPRQHQIGQFDKHVWGLWDEFQIRAHEDGPGSQYIGAQGFNLGGRSIFWGGLIPRMATYEMEPWPQDIKWYLEDGGYAQAEDLMNRSPTPPSPLPRAHQAGKPSTVS